MIYIDTFQAESLSGQWPATVLVRVQGLSQAFYSLSCCALILKLCFLLCIYMCVCVYVQQLCFLCENDKLWFVYFLMQYDVLVVLGTADSAGCLPQHHFLHFPTFSLLLLRCPSAVVVRGLVVSSHFWLIEFHFETNRNFHFAQLNSGVQTTVCCDTLCWEIFKIELLPSKCEFNLIKTISTVAYGQNMKSCAR